MIPAVNTRHYRLKAALRDLIDACGGIERTAALTTLGKSTVGRWRDPESRDWPTLGALAQMEAECGRADVTRALADLAGLTLADTPPAPADGNASLMARHAETVTSAAAMMAEGAMAFSDSRVTPAEAAAMDRAAAALGEALGAYRTALATVRGEGGADVRGSRIAGGGL